MYQYYKERTKQAQRTLEEAENEKVRKDSKIVDSIIGKENNWRLTSGQQRLSLKIKKDEGEEEEQAQIEDSKKNQGFGSQLLNTLTE